MYAVHLMIQHGTNAGTLGTLSARGGLVRYLGIANIARGRARLRVARRSDWTGLEWTGPGSQRPASYLESWLPAWCMSHETVEAAIIKPIPASSQMGESAASYVRRYVCTRAWVGGCHSFPKGP